jgi:succinoglycan biosynthesis protein ExoL
MICPRVVQPRYRKRERDIREWGAVKVAAFVRPDYELAGAEARNDIIKLGIMHNRQYASRLPTLIKAQRILSRETRSADVMYAFSLDCYVLGRMSGLGPGIMEIGDLRTIDTRNPITRLIERWVLRDCRAVVITSNGFDAAYLKSLRPQDVPVRTIENKLDRSLADSRPALPRSTERPICIGLVGLLRYRRPIELLLRFVEEHPEFALRCHGVGPYESLVQAKESSRISYFGRFESPRDLSEIYSQIDVSYVVYDTDSANVRLAMPNKYYESAFFGVPLLAATGTELSRQACAAGIGAAVSTVDYGVFEETMLRHLDLDWLVQAKRNCAQIPASVLIDDGKQILSELLEQVGAEH